MVGKLAELVTGEQVVTVLVVVFLLGYFIYKEWPEFRRRVSSGSEIEHRHDEADRDAAKRLGIIENRMDVIEDKLAHDMDVIEDKLARDYDRLNQIDREERRMKQLLSESLEERGVIMQALLGTLKGLHQLGANGPTEEAQALINEYLNKQAHKKED